MSVNFELAHNGQLHRFASSLLDDELFRAVKEKVASIVQEDDRQLYWKDASDLKRLLHTSTDLSRAIFSENLKNPNKDPCVHLFVVDNNALYEAEIEKLKNDLSTEKKTNARLTEMVTIEEDKVNGLSDAIRRKDSELLQLDHELQQMRRTGEEKTAENAEKERHLNEQIEKLVENAAVNELDIELLGKTVKIMIQQHNKKQAKIAELIAANEEIYRELKCQFETADEEQDDALQRFLDSEREMDELRNTISKKNDEIATLIVDLEGMEDRYNYVSAKNAEMEKEKDAELSSCLRLIKKWEELYNDATAKNAQLEEELKNAREDAKYHSQWRYNDGFAHGAQFQAGLQTGAAGAALPYQYTEEYGHGYRTGREQYQLEQDRLSKEVTPHADFEISENQPHDEVAVAAQPTECPVEFEEEEESEDSNVEEDDDWSNQRSISREQKAVLESRFVVNRYVNAAEASDIAAELALTEDQVCVWFCERRYKWSQDEAVDRCDWEGDEEEEENEKENESNDEDQEVEEDDNIDDDIAENPARDYQGFINNLYLDDVYDDDDSEEDPDWIPEYTVPSEAFRDERDEWNGDYWSATIQQKELADLIGDIVPCERLEELAKRLNPMEIARPPTSSEEEKNESSDDEEAHTEDDQQVEEVDQMNATSEKDKVSLDMAQFNAGFAAGAQYETGKHAGFNGGRLPTEYSVAYEIGYNSGRFQFTQRQNRLNFCGPEKASSLTPKYVLSIVIADRVARASSASDAPNFIKKQFGEGFACGAHYQAGIQAGSVGDAKPALYTAEYEQGYQTCLRQIQQEQHLEDAVVEKKEKSGNEVADIIEEHSIESLQPTAMPVNDAANVESEQERKITENVLEMKKSSFWDTMASFSTKIETIGEKMEDIEKKIEEVEEKNEDTEWLIDEIEQRLDYVEDKIDEMVEL